jgi:hypothetical protein
VTTNGGKRLGRLVEEHHAELAHRHVEGRIVPLIGLHIHLDEAGATDSGPVESLSCKIEKRRGEVVPDHLPIGTHRLGEGDRERTSTTSDFAQPLTW